VQAEKGKVTDLIDVFLVFKQMIGKGKNERDLQKLRRLKRDKPEVDPCEVICARAPDTEGGEGQQCDADRERQVDEPQLRQLVLPLVSLRID